MVNTWWVQHSKNGSWHVMSPTVVHPCEPLQGSWLIVCIRCVFTDDTFILLILLDDPPSFPIIYHHSHPIVNDGTSTWFYGAMAVALGCAGPLGSFALHGMVVRRKSWCPTQLPWADPARRVGAGTREWRSACGTARRGDKMLGARGQPLVEAARSQN